MTGSAFLAALASRASLTPITEKRPSAIPATSTITTPRPVKKPICSNARVTDPPTGLPGLMFIPLQVGPITLPSANQAPPSAASHAPKCASGREALISTIRPPSTVAAPGRISSQKRPVV